MDKKQILEDKNNSERNLVSDFDMKGNFSFSYI